MGQIRMLENNLQSYFKKTGLIGEKADKRFHVLFIQGTTLNWSKDSNLCQKEPDSWQSYRLWPNCSDLMRQELRQQTIIIWAKISPPMIKLRLHCFSGSYVSSKQPWCWQTSTSLAWTSWQPLCQAPLLYISLLEVCTLYGKWCQSKWHHRKTATC